MVADMVHVQGTFYNVEVYKQDHIKDLVQKNVSGKMDSYLKKTTQKKDAVVSIDYKVEKNKKNKYIAKFRLMLDGKQYVYAPNKPFKFEEDLINHAFDHFKSSLAS